MAFTNFGEDDPFASQNGDWADSSLARVVVPVDLDMQEVNELERVRQARLAEVIEKKRASEFMH